MIGKEIFVEKLAKKRGITKSEASDFVRDFLEVLEESCENDGGVSFKGSFTFKTAIKKGRSGKVNGIEYHTQDSKTVKLSVSPILLDKLNK